MARLGRGQPVPPIILRSSLADVVAGDYPLRPVTVVPPDRSRITRRLAQRPAVISHGLMNGTGLPFNFPTEILQIGVFVAPGALATDDPDVWPWIDITSYGLNRGGTIGIRITRGATSENTQAPVARMSLELNNRDGRFSTQNYAGPYWPNLVRGTPIRVTVTVGSTTYTRFTGRLDELPPRWDVSGNDRWVPVTASGIMRRLGVGVTTGVTVLPPVVSASEGDPDIVGSWPCTDTAGSGAASAISGAGTLCRNDDTKLIWAQVTGPDGMTLLPSFSAGGVLSGAVPTGSSTTWSAEVEALVDGTSSGTTLYPLVVDTDGTARQFLLEFKNDGGTNLLWLNAGGTVAAAISTYYPARSNTWLTWSIRAQQSGSDISVDLRVDGTSIGTATISSQTCGKPTYITLGDGQVDVGIRSMGYARTYGTVTPSTAVSTAVAGYVTETAVDRFERLCAAQPVPYEVFGTSAQLMGPQSSANLLTQLRECETVDAGLLAESTAGRIALYCRGLKENATSALTLDMSAGEIAVPFEPDDSDATVVNKSTAALSWDSSATSTVTDQDHIDLYQLYEGPSISANAESASQLPALAGLPVWLGTYTGLHYPQVSINLARNPELAATCAALDFHDRITITNCSEPPNDDIDLLLIGCTEELGQYHWTQRWTTTPYARWNVGVIVATPTASDAGGWIVPDSLVLAEDLDTSETAVDVTSVPVLPTGAANYPATFRVGAELMQVTACSGASAPQTLTVSRGYSGSPAMTHVNLDPVEIESAVVMTL